MKFSKFFIAPMVICSVFSCNCIASITVNFQENDKYFVKLCEKEYTFNGIKDFSQGFKNIAGEFIYYTDARRVCDTFVFSDFIFNENKCIIDPDKKIYTQLTFQTDWRFKKYIVLNYKEDEKVYLPEINLHNIDMLFINSDYDDYYYETYDGPQCGQLHYNDLKRIYFNGKPISIKNLSILTPASDTRALLDVYIRQATNDWCNIF